MHIPDGMLSNTTLATTGVASASVIAYSVAWVRENLDQRRVVLMAVLAALIFALQMLNFPIAAGTSGHFAGGALAAIVLGPLAAVIVMTSVLVVQALLFADGGVLALAANVLNLAVIAPLVAWGAWTAVRRATSSPKLRAAGWFAAAWASCMAAALAASVEVWASGNARLELIGAAMALLHAFVGIGEGVITLALLTYVSRVRPDLLEPSGLRPRVRVRRLAIGLAAFGIVAVAFSFVASSAPDAMEYAYRAVGRPLAHSPGVPAPFAGYAFPGVTSDALAAVLAGSAGVLVTGAGLYAMAGRLKARRRASHDTAPERDEASS